MSIFKVYCELLLLSKRKIEFFSCRYPGRSHPYYLFYSSSCLSLSPSQLRLCAADLDRSRRLQKRKFSNDSNICIIKSPYQDIRVEHTSLTHFLWKDVSKWADREAVCCADTGRKYTYKELRKLCRRFAISLRRNKFKKGQVLSIILPNVPEYPVVLLGAIEAGLTATTLNPNFTAEEISNQLMDSKSSIIVILNSLREKIHSAKKLIEEKMKVEFRFTLVTVKDESDSVSNFEAMIDGSGGDQFDLNDVDVDVDIKHDDVAILPYSSGTTGFPKGVQLTHSNILHNLLQTNSGNVKYCEETTENFQEVIPAVLPFFHIFGMTAYIFLSVTQGCKIISMKKFDVGKYLKILEDEKATILYLVPALVSFFASHPSIKDDCLKNVRVSFLAGGCTSETEIEKLMRLGQNKMKFLYGYGLTETSPAATVSIASNDWRTVGKPLANTFVKIVDFDGAIKGSYQHGEICIKGPQVMKGYLNNPTETAAVIDRDGFFHTGDLGYYNDEKNLYCEARIKELIKVKGFQVSPTELECVLKSHKSVSEAGVVGVPDKRYGEMPVAFVVLAPKQAQLLPLLLEKSHEDVLKRFVADKVAPYKRLGRVIFVESLPKNATGKILKRLLLEKYEHLI